ncbi:MAG: hypothetical protein PHG91_13455 [Syntrophales bacterium]|nr:hypothetical protein [Syntrophales bacterium]
MNEIVEMIFQWHQGAGFKQIRRSLGFDRNTVRKYIRLAQMTGVARGAPFPPEEELALRLQTVGDAYFSRTTPARALIAPHRDWIAEVIP